LPIPGPRPKYRDSGLGSQNEPRRRRVSCTFWNQQRPLFASNRRRKHHLGLGAKLDRRNYILLYRNRLRYGATGKPEFKRSFLPRTGINTDPNSNSYNFAYADTQSNSYSYSKSHSHSDPNTHAYADTYSNAHTHSYADPNPNTHSNADAEPNPNSNSHSDAQSNTNPDPFSDD
jgi:hypothetical protein